MPPLRNLWVFGVVFNNGWIFGRWEHGFIKKFKPSIEYLELFALCVGVIAWADRLKNCRVILFCDNQAVLQMVNNTTSSCKNCMHVLRLLVVNNIVHNRRIFIKYVKSADNKLADSLSRLDLNRFWREAPDSMNRFPDAIPDSLWPLSRIWRK